MDDTGAGDQDTLRLSLCGRWAFTRAGRPLVVRRREQRLLSLLALHGSSTRHRLAGTLWPECPEDRALGSLRSAVWHIRMLAPDALAITGEAIDLGPAVRVDVQRIRQRALDVAAHPSVADVDVAVSALAHCELLPGWDEQWMEYERERLRQLVLRALEALAHDALEREDLRGTISAAALAAHLEPLQESPRRSLIAAHLLLGNVADAVSEYRQFRETLRSELGVGPSEQLTALVRGRVIAIGG